VTQETRASARVSPRRAPISAGAGIRPVLLVFLGVTFGAEHLEVTIEVHVYLAAVLAGDFDLVGAFLVAFLGPGDTATSLV